MLSSQTWDFPDVSCTFVLNPSYTGEVIRKDIALPSQGCARIPLNILKCVSQDGKHKVEFARGKQKDIYSIMESNAARPECIMCQMCHGDYISVIHQRVVDINGDIVRPLCPQ